MPHTPLEISIAARITIVIKRSGVAAAKRANLRRQLQDPLCVVG
jgi:hypothetical protein